MNAATLRLSLVFLAAVVGSALYGQSISSGRNEIGVLRDRVESVEFPTVQWITPAEDGATFNTSSIQVAFRVSSSAHLLYVTIQSGTMLSPEVLEPVQSSPGLSAYSYELPLEVGEDSIVVTAQTIGGAQSASLRIVTRKMANQEKRPPPTVPGPESPSLQVKRVVQNKNVISIFYDLVDPNTSNRYTIRMYSSMDQFSHELQHVEGAVGLAVDHGQNRQINFDFSREFGNDFAAAQEEKLSFELRAELYVSFMNLKAMPKTIKRARSYSLKWNVPGPTRDLSVMVLKDGEMQQRVVVNSSKDLDLVLPRSAPLGSGYSLQITDPDQTEFVTPEFKVVRRVPLAYLVAVPAVVIGAVVFILTYEAPPERLPDPGKPD